MTVPFSIRPATEADATAMRAIYRPFVEDSAVSFELITPSEQEFAGRVRASLEGWQWLVAEPEGRALGYAYGTSHRARPAYRWSVEVSAYVDPQYQRQGIGRALYLRLFGDLARKGFCNAFAGVTMPNQASVALHRSLGFEPIGVFRSVGWKFGQWHDVGWYQRPLRDGPAPE
ncbi:MAG TPA: N-acetyltransferase family protein [Xanthomonadaceae bacterium]|nr:N-acetyltransferase family protein [Xanthomonadaceae bacterium]